MVRQRRAIRSTAQYWRQTNRGVTLSQTRTEIRNGRSRDRRRVERHPCIRSESDLAVHADHAER